MRRSIYKTEARSALIAAIVALVVAAPLSNAAHEGVSSAVKVVKGERGKTGKRGPRGLTGPQGPKGEPGRDAATPDPFGPVRILPGETKTVLARCEWPDDATGGNVHLASWPSNAGPISTVREGVGSMGEATLAYFASVENVGDNIALVHATAVCG